MHEDVTHERFEAGGGHRGPPATGCCVNYAERRTFSPRGPLGPWPRSNVTVCPSRNSSKCVWVQAELWKKYSVPSPARMKPKPLSETRRLMVPLSEAMVDSFGSR